MHFHAFNYVTMHFHAFNYVTMHFPTFTQNRRRNRSIAHRGRQRFVRRAVCTKPCLHFGLSTKLPWKFCGWHYSWILSSVLVSVGFFSSFSKYEIDRVNTWLWLTVSVEIVPECNIRQRICIAISNMLPFTNSAPA